MKNLTALDPETKSPDLIAENIEELKALFPELVTEGPGGVSVNVDVLRQLVGDKTVTDVEEKYGLNWHGKRRARQIALTPSTGTLRPCPEDSVDWDTTQNLMIEGDNLEVLKLLQKSYAGKVKLIYIDPPYNTGKDFVYPDDFQDNIRNYLELTGQVDGEGRKISSNTEASGRFHTDWLNMMYPRLKLARNLLREDGVIAVSVDDAEVGNLRRVLDEVFGEEQFQAQIVVQSNKRGQTYKQIAKTHEFLVVYSKSETIELNELEKAADALPYSDSLGAFDLWELRNRNPKFGRFNRPNLFFPIYVVPDSLDDCGYARVSLEPVSNTCVKVLPLNSEADTGIRFGIVEKYQFAAIPVTDEAGRTTALGVAQSEAIWTHLKESGYVDAKGRVQDELRKALVQETLQLPEPFRPHLPQVRDILRKLAGKLDVKDANQRVQIRTRQAVLHSPEFQTLWDRIKHKTTYRVKFDNERLVTDCVKAIQDCPPITKTRVHIRKADLAIGRGGVDAAETAAAAPVTLDETDIELPDVLTDLQDKTQLTRRSLVRILSDSGRLDDFARNPQQFIELATESINRTKRMALVDGIKYQRLGDEYYYAQELFEQEELTGYLKNTLAVTKSVHEHVVYDLGGERTFAEKLEQNEAVKVYAKLPGWFKVPTPLGTYNPDWAVLVEQNGTERLFFVVETKPSLFTEDLRGKEDAKIECGKAHFKELSAGDQPVEYVIASNFDDFTKHW